MDVGSSQLIVYRSLLRPWAWDWHRLKWGPMLVPSVDSVIWLWIDMLPWLTIGGHEATFQWCPDHSVNQEQTSQPLSLAFKFPDVGLSLALARILHWVQGTQAKLAFDSLEVSFIQHMVRVGVGRMVLITSFNILGFGLDFILGYGSSWHVLFSIWSLGPWFENGDSVSF